MIYPNDYIDKVIQGDCIEVMKGIPDKSIDLVLTDPPYGISYLSSRTKNHTKIANDGYSDWITLMPLFLKEAQRITTDTGCVVSFCGGGRGTPTTAIFTIEAMKHFNLIQTLVWHKFIGLGWKYRPAYENIVVLSKSKDNYNFYDTSKKCSNVIRCNQYIPQANDHPTQKPVNLIMKLLEIHSKPNDIVLDPFLGGGTTAVACIKLNRKFIGVELSDKYCNMAQERVRVEREKQLLF